MISFLCLLCCFERKDWGSISVGKDADGHLEAVLENSRIRVRYGYFKGPHIDETVIKEFIIKGADENQAGRSLDACARRGVLTKAEIKADGPKVKTVHLEFDGGEKQQDVSIYPNSTYIKIDYIDAGINIVDIGDRCGSTGEWVIYGADKWKPEIVGYPKVYFDRNPDDVGKNPLGWVK